MINPLFELKEQMKKQEPQIVLSTSSSTCKSSTALRYNEDEGREEKLVHEKLCVQHNYHDHSKDNDSVYLEKHIVAKGGVSIPFPIKLHNMLDHIALHETELSNIVSWQPHGRCFCVKNTKELTEKILPRFFQQRKYASFQRQLNLYDFKRLTAGPDKGSYYHKLFLRSKKLLCRGIKRIMIKGTKYRKASNPKQEPNFYMMDPMPPIDDGMKEDTSSSTTGPEMIITTPTNIMTKAKKNSTATSIPNKSHLKLSSTTRLPASSFVKIEQGIFKPRLVTKKLTGELSDLSTGTNNVVPRDDLVQKEEHCNGAHDDLRFIFGGMPFHSLSIADIPKPSTSRTSMTCSNYRKSSSTFQIPLSDNSLLEDLEDFERRLNHIANLGSRTAFTDLEMSDILDRIVCFERQLNHIANLGSNRDLTDIEMSDILDRIVCDELLLNL